MIGIYKITSPTGKIYIGQSTNIERRMNYYSRLKCKSQLKIYNSLKKYGWINHQFEVLEECDINILNLRERYYQDLYECLGENGLNCYLTECEGKNKLLSEETKKRISAKAIGRRHTDESRKKMVESSAKRNLTPDIRRKFATQIGRKLSDKARKAIDWTGKKHTEESKKKMRVAKLGKKVSADSVEKTRLKNIGKKRTQESKDKIAARIKGIKRSEHTKYLNSIAKEGKIVVNLENGVFYHSIGLAARSHNLHEDYLKRRLNGKIKNNTRFVIA